MSSICEQWDRKGSRHARTVRHHHKFNYYYNRHHDNIVIIIILYHRVFLYASQSRSVFIQNPIRKTSVYLFKFMHAMVVYNRIISFLAGDINRHWIEKWRRKNLRIQPGFEPRTFWYWLCPARQYCQLIMSRIWYSGVMQLSHQLLVLYYYICTHCQVIHVHVGRSSNSMYVTIMRDNNGEQCLAYILIWKNLSFWDHSAFSQVGGERIQAHAVVY